MSKEEVEPLKTRPIGLKDINDNLRETVYLLGLILMELKQQ